MKKSITILWLCLLLFFIASAQEINVNLVSKVQEYPLVKLKIQQRKPQVLNTTDFVIKENDSVLPFTFNYLGIKQPKDTTQNILILVENLNHSDRMQFYKESLINSLENLKVKHKINIGVFDRVRNKGTKSVYLLLNEFTNDKNKLVEAINQIQPKNDVFSNNKSSDLYHAVYEGVNILQNKKGLKTILLLSTAFNNKWSSHTSSESSKAYALKQHIPIYSLQYRKQGFEHHKLTDLVLETYGNEKITNNTQEASLFIIETINNLNKRLGNEYLISYNSSFKKNGETNTATINVDDELFNYQVKTNNIYKWFYFGIALLLSLILLFFIKNNFKKQRQKNKEKLALLDDKIKSEKIKNEQILQNLKQQESVIKKLKTEEEAKLHNKELLKKEAMLFAKMKMFGSLPIIQYQIDGKKTSYVIKKSTVFIGRAPTNDIILSDKQISREHAKIIFDNGYFIIDLQSAKGTYVNNKKVDKKDLNHGNIIQLGNTKLTFIL